MTADHPTREERYAAVLRLHRLMARGLSNTEAECTCGGWRSGGLWDEAGKSFDSHVAAALVAADPAPAQPDAALSDDERAEFARAVCRWWESNDDLEDACGGPHPDPCSACERTTAGGCGCES